MIIKGGSRSAPKQLARHLLRRDQNERVEILQCDGSPTNDLAEALADFQAMTAATNGKKGLYHANIDPAAKYQMTRAQWERAADVLAEELGLSGQPRILILHQKQGREHVHVVWARTDLENGRLIADSHNYRAHEKASHRLEIEFGHEHTPGVHHKRNPEKERPVAAFEHAAWQQAERTGHDPRDRKEIVTELFRNSANGQAFKTALEAHGYQLAQSDRRAFLLVDQAGEVFSLARQVTGAKTKDVREKLQDLETLPTVDEARARIKQAEMSRESQPQPINRELLREQFRPEARRLSHQISEAKDLKTKQAQEWKAKEREWAAVRKEFGQNLARSVRNDPAADQYRAEHRRNVQDWITQQRAALREKHARQRRDLQELQRVERRLPQPERRQPEPPALEPPAPAPESLQDQWNKYLRERRDQPKDKAKDRDRGGREPLSRAFNRSSLRGYLVRAFNFASRAVASLRKAWRRVSPQGPTPPRAARPRLPRSAVPRVP